MLPDRSGLDNWLKLLHQMENLLVAVLLEVLFVAVVLQHHLRVAVHQPVCIVQLRQTQLVLQLLALSATRDRC